MALAPGTRIGPYEIAAPIGAGGMGEVYRAIDTNLKRATAIKVLPDSVASEPERLARFQREAEVLASLNHPNIAAVYGLERSGAAIAIAMELVDGPTLADRILVGPLPVDDALAIAKQIAEGLEAAHDLGIVHRDLKPANIKVRPDGTVKILDFGLAKALDPAASVSPGASLSPTITSPAMTQMGMVLGTAAYMSPEQARGKPVDKRADIWAFGCVLFEMLTGKYAFHGEDVSLTFAEIMKSEPDWNALPPLPSAVRVCLRRCLLKDPRQRLRDIGEVRLALSGSYTVDEAATVPVVLPQPTGAGWKWAMPAAALSAIAAAALTFWWMRPAAPMTPDVVRFQIHAPAGSKIPPGTPAISPDGRSLAYSMVGADRIPRIHLHDLRTMVTRPLPGTEHGVHPFWSPNGRSLAFVSDRTLKRIDVAGGPARDLAQVSGPWHGSWSPFGEILFTVFGIGRISEDGGKHTLAVEVNKAAGETGAGFPAFLPDGKRFFLRVEREEKSAIHLATTESASRSLILDDVLSAPLVAPTPSGTYLLYLRDDALVAQAIDDRAGTVVGAPRVMVEGIGRVANPPLLPTISVAPTGVLAYQVGGDFTSMVLQWVDRTGTALGEVPLEVTGQNPSLSPDGKMVALEVSSSGDRDVWVADVTRGVTSRITHGGGLDRSPVWSPDGRRIAYSRARQIHVTNADGTGDDTVLADVDGLPESWSPDGRHLLYRVQQAMSLLPLSGGAPTPVGSRAGSSRWGQFSPDSRAIAYASNESGRDEIYVQLTPPASGRVRVSANGGAQPRWGKTSNELLYLSADRSMMSVEIRHGEALSAGVPKKLFQLEAGSVFTNTRFDIDEARDRFLVPRVAGERLPDTPITVVLNWWAEFLQHPR